MTKMQKPCQANFIRQQNQWASSANPLIHPSARKVDMLKCERTAGSFRPCVRSLTS